MNVKMGDWESVVSKDGKEEWVTMWYKQIWEDNKGKKDSADYIDDLRLKMVKSSGWMSIPGNCIKKLH